MASPVAAGLQLAKKNPHTISEYCNSLMIENIGIEMARYTFLTMAEETLLDESKPMSGQEIWEAAVRRQLDKKLGSTGRTPSASLNALLLVDVRDHPETAFVRNSVRPARYSLKDLEKSRLSIARINQLLNSGAAER